MRFQQCIFYILLVLLPITGNGQSEVVEPLPSKEPEFDLGPLKDHRGPGPRVTDYEYLDDISTDLKNLVYFNPSTGQHNYFVRMGTVFLVGDLKDNYRTASPLFNLGWRSNSPGMYRIKTELLVGYSQTEVLRPLYHKEVIVEKGTDINYFHLEINISKQLFEKKRLAFYLECPLLRYAIIHMDLNMEEVRRGSVLMEVQPSPIQGFWGIGVGAYWDYKLLKESAKHQLLFQTRYSVILISDNMFMHEVTIGLAKEF